jgi:putative ABC transport system permease protein
VLFLAWRYVAYHRFKSAILIGSITLILYVPVGLRVLVNQSSQELTERAAATPLVIGAKGGALELVLNTLYFRADWPAPITHADIDRVTDSGLAAAIPIYARFQSRGLPVVGTSLDYFEFRGLEVVEGRQMAMLGEAVVGAAVSDRLDIGPGDSVISSPESVFDVAGIYPLKLNIVGVLADSDGPDDDAIFVDVRTSWIIEGIGHGHQDLARPEAARDVLSREGDEIVANAAVVQYNEITADNIESFHFHGDISGFPLTAVIAVPPDQRSSTMLQGRYQGTDETLQITRPHEVMDELMATVLTIERFVVVGAVVVGLATLATATLVFLLSLRLRRREIETLFKIGGSRSAVALITGAEVIVVLVVSVALAGSLTLLTSQFGGLIIRAWIRA